MKNQFKENDSTFFLIFLKGKVLNGKLIRRPEFMVMEGTVASIWNPEDNKSINILSVEVEKWPLRYLLPPEQCFKTKKEATEVANRENLKIKEKF